MRVFSLGAAIFACVLFLGGCEKQTAPVYDAFSCVLSDESYTLRYEQTDAGATDFMLARCGLPASLRRGRRFAVPACDGSGDRRIRVAAGMLLAKRAHGQKWHTDRDCDPSSEPADADAVRCHRIYTRAAVGMTDIPRKKGHFII